MNSGVKLARRSGRPRNGRTRMDYNPPRPTRLDEVPASHVTLARDVLIDRAGYPSANDCPAAQRLKFEETARMVCAIIIDEEKSRHGA